MLDWAQHAGSAWQYVVLFIFSAAPWVDVSLMVPLGILWGLPPIPVSIVVFLGNFLLIILLGIFFKRISAWRKSRMELKGSSKMFKQETRSRKIWEKYGIPGLALLAPVIIGTDIAAILALSFGSSKLRVVVWMTISLGIWTVIFAIGSVYGFSFLHVTR
ncbi:small multi-drug export protein [Peribacillus kribbensis]|uniref:small multi-drug export protein n=1 Tax=Peribacillus kribbensis TaxID=356658 RepID=UPI0004232EBB|nr:small multi-drug export protein [Peribacillus kribbensis]